MTAASEIVCFLAAVPELDNMGLPQRVETGCGSDSELMEADFQLQKLWFFISKWGLIKLTTVLNKQIKNPPTNALVLVVTWHENLVPISCQAAGYFKAGTKIRRLSYCTQLRK